ncbi:MAG: DUF222 domain-containing protein [Pseudolysinimonas sp.]|uniref:HNH endonuclease signature motif containing protein n=1 Tax=Pseudolysinimonas sp. TaxID=2680009 RepID=UPI003265851E
MTFATLPALDAALRSLREVPRVAGDYAAAADSELLDVSRVVAEITRLAGAHSALAAGQIAHRSRPELGGAGLARRQGARTVEELLTTTMKVTGRDAATAVRVGKLTDQVGPFAVVASGVAAGSVSVEAADAIRGGLGGFGADDAGSMSAGRVDEGLLARAAELLCDEARLLDPDRLRKRAREVRDELDEAGVADRENVLRLRRSLRRIDLRDGMKRIIWDYDPETAGIVDDIYDRATSPRRGGPRFVDSEKAARASELERDERTVEQIASDSFAELLRQSASVDQNVLIGSATPSVRIIVSAEALESPTGHGYAEGSGESFSRATIERVACANGTQSVLVDSVGNVLDLGREQRLYSSRQRVALAVRDGGCMWPTCERPPSWTEAHHIDHWARDDGRTDVARGILLCRHHHLRLHNEGWRIILRAGRYWLEPPDGSAKIGAMLETKSRAMRAHLSRRQPDAQRELTG